ncbi:MAG: Lipoprotein signal peptidase [Cytophagales bacterium]|jgi:signal peptidase II|nr:lipoprotein signal peptidase [Bacteroidota bacterium]MBS1980557.1 lipoprotein signal peptidase [Bacteroidota bacterium]WHZ07879.1 MAG: Lipoprotein signal peptidase [Cytophagales bacterium]
MKFLKYLLIALLVICVDQTSKLLVYAHMQLGDEINVIGTWFRLHYLLNPGMAFGIRWENEFGKLALTVFRIGAMVAIGYYLYSSVKKNLHVGFLICLALILGGAVGNVIDSTFYGVFLDNNALGMPTKWFHGEVIDMLYFPLFHFTVPEWFPLNPGGEFEFFSPVFNIADSSIFIGVVTILIFQKRFFPHPAKEDSPGETLEMNQEEPHTTSDISVTETTASTETQPD